MLNTIPKRPILRYHGAKWQQAKHILSYFPEHKRYVEPFCGGASLLLKKPRAYAEIINDLNDDIVNLFEVIRCDLTNVALIDLIDKTPYSRVEFEKARSSNVSFSVQRAANFIIRSQMGFNSASPNTGFRSNSSRKGSIPAHNWCDMGEVIYNASKRLRGVVIEHQPAIKTMHGHDCENTLHFVDPPYLPETRTPTSAYVNDMDYQGHVELLGCLNALKGMVVLCGYQSGLYHEKLELNGWALVKKQTFTAQKQPRVECLWLNELAQEKLKAGVT